MYEPDHDYVYDRKLALEWLMGIAKKRQKIHKDMGHKTTGDLPRKLHLEFLSLVVEYDFAQWAGLAMDYSIRPYGDRGVDFTLPNGVTIDIKASEKGNHLFLPVDHKHHADIYVLGRYVPDEVSRFLGWEHYPTIVTSPSKRFNPRGPINYYIHQRELRTMNWLAVYIQDVKEKHGG